MAAVPTAADFLLQGGLTAHLALLGTCLGMSREQRKEGGVDLLSDDKTWTANIGVTEWKASVAML